MADGFVFLPSYYEAISNLPDAERLALYDALCMFGLYGEEPANLPPMAKGFFILIRPNIESSKARYKANTENGRKGGAPKGNKNAKKQPKNNPETTEIQPKNNQDMDKENDMDIDKDGDKEKSKPPRHKHGEYSNVLLSDEELTKLQADYPDYKERIERLSSYMASTGKSYKSHYATIRRWAAQDKEEGKGVKQDAKPKSILDEYGEDIPKCFRTIQVD